MNAEDIMDVVGAALRAAEDNEFKVNLPYSEESYESGNGEGCFAELEGEALAAYNDDAEGGVYEAVLCNDSWYYPGLMHGTRVPIEMRGERRPVVPYAWLVENYGDQAAARKDVLVGFLAGQSEGACPLCGAEDAEAVDSDEGPADDHWFSREYRCLECGCEFTEKYSMHPVDIEVTRRP